MSEIITYDWTLGDGNTSSLSAPTNTYSTGYYSVDLELLTTLGYYSNITKTNYIKVQNEDITNFTTDYLNNKHSFHYGWDNITSYGWSENSGDEWVWLESAGAIMDYFYLGDKYKLVWDIYDDKQYIINVGTGRILEEFTDKSIDGDDGTEIATEIITPEFNGEKEVFNLSHIQTDIAIRGIDNFTDINDDFITNVSLYDSKSSTPVETKSDINEDAETVFFYQNKNTDSNNHRQIGITTDESRFKITSIDSMYKVVDRSRNAHKDVDALEKAVSYPVDWFSRGRLISGSPSITRNRVSGTIMDNYTSWDLETGPDGYTGSAGTPVSVDSVYSCEGYSNGDTVTLFAIAKTEIGEEIIQGLTFTQTGESIGGMGNEYYRFYYTGVANKALDITNDLTSMYDFRAYYPALTSEEVEYLSENYERFIPRF